LLSRPRPRPGLVLLAKLGGWHSTVIGICIELLFIVSPVASGQVKIEKLSAVALPT